MNVGVISLRKIKAGMEFVIRGRSNESIYFGSSYYNFNLYFQEHTP